MDIGDSDGICVSMWEQKRNTDQLIFTLNLHDGCIRLSLLKERTSRYVASLKGERWTCTQNNYDRSRTLLFLTETRNSSSSYTQT